MLTGIISWVIVVSSLIFSGCIMGRKGKSGRKKSNRVRVHFMLSPKALQFLREVAERNKRPLSAQVEFMLEEAAENGRA